MTFDWYNAPSIPFKGHWRNVGIKRPRDRRGQVTRDEIDPNSVMQGMQQPILAMA